MSDLTEETSGGIDSLQKRVSRVNEKKLGRSHAWDQGPFYIVGRDNQLWRPLEGILSRNDLMQFKKQLQANLPASEFEAFFPDDQSFHTRQKAA